MKQKKEKAILVVIKEDEREKLNLLKCILHKRSVSETISELITSYIKNNTINLGDIFNG